MNITRVLAVFFTAISIFNTLLGCFHAPVNATFYFSALTVGWLVTISMWVLSFTMPWVK